MVIKKKDFFVKKTIDLLFKNIFDKNILIQLIFIYINFYVLTKAITANLPKLN